MVKQQKKVGRPVFTFIVSGFLHPGNKGLFLVLLTCHYLGLHPTFMPSWSWMSTNDIGQLPLQVGFLSASVCGRPLWETDPSVEERRTQLWLRQGDIDGSYCWLLLWQKNGVILSFSMLARVSIFFSSCSSGWEDSSLVDQEPTETPSPRTQQQDQAPDLWPETLTIPDL